MMTTNFDFIDNLSSYILSRYPVHPLWAKLLSATTLSSVMTWNTNFYNRYGKNRMNLWGGYFAPSGDFKSTPVDEITMPLLQSVGEELKHDFMLPSIASTVEGLIDYFTEIMKKDQRLWGGLVWRDEMTTFFKESLNKDYMSDEMEVYSKMYDGSVPGRKTRAVYTKYVPVYMTLLAATTPRYLYNQMPIQFFFQGCGNRFLYVLHHVKGRTYTSDDLFVHKPPKWCDGGLPLELEPFKNCLVEAAQSNFEILIDIEAEELSTKFRNERERLKDSINEHSLTAFKREYISRDWQKSLKLAQLRCFSREFQKQHIKKMKVISITTNDIEWGQNIVRDCFTHFETMVKEWMLFKKENPIDSFSDIGLALKYMEVIKNHKIVSQTQLAFEVGNIKRNDTFYEVLGYLMSVDCVRQLTDTAEFVRMQGIEWMRKQKIQTNFRSAPKLYEFVRDLDV